MKEKINVFDYSAKFTKDIMKGFLLTTKANGKVNSMVIGWGTIGIQWGKPICIVYVRTSRFTHELLEENPEFTVNIPIDHLEEDVFRICGSLSGKDMDKIKEAHLTLEEGQCVSVPGIKEAPITIECKVIYKQTQVVGDYTDEIRKKYYCNGEGKAEGQQAVHTAFYGEIVNAYMIK